MVSKARRFYSGATGRVAERRFVRAAEKKGLIVTKTYNSMLITGYLLKSTPSGV